MSIKTKYTMIYLLFMSAGSEVISSYSSSSSSSSIMAESVIPEMPPAMCLEKPSVDFSYVGIDAILEQMRRKAMKQGFELNIMVVGESTFPALISENSVRYVSIKCLHYYVVLD